MKKIKHRSFSDREKNLYIFIENYILKNKYSPSFEEMLNNTDYSSKGSLFKVLRKLRDKNVINFIDKQSRTISLNNLIVKIDKRKNNLILKGDK